MPAIVAATFLALGAALAPGAGLAAPARAAARAESVTFTHRDYDVHIQANGDVNVDEHWEVYFSGGPYQSATTGVFLGHTRGVQFDHVVGADANSEHTANVTGAQEVPIAKISWMFPATKDAARTFTIPYTIHGALGLNGTQAWLDRHFFDGPGRGDYPIKASRVTVTLPKAAAASDVQVKVSYPGAQLQSGRLDDATIFAQGQNLDSGQPLELEVVFPRGQLDASVPRPSWQQGNTPPNPPTALERDDAALATPSPGDAGGPLAAFFDNIWLVMAVGLVIIAILGFIAWRLSRRVRAGLEELAALRAGDGADGEVVDMDLPDDETPFQTKPLPAINLDFGAVEWPQQHEEPDLEALGLHPLDTGKDGPISRVGEPWDEHDAPPGGDAPEAERGTGAPSGVGQGGE